MTTERVMLLIDADNVSVDVMDQAVRLLLKQHGALHVRRAYCTAESAVANQAIFKHLGIKPMVNLATGKNSTDIALAVDAIDLVLAERPDVVAIASSDSDFAPLVQRLREKGCVVRGIGQAGKTGDETQGVYDEFTVLEHRKGAEAVVVPGRKTARKTAPRKSATASTAAKAPARAAARTAAKTAAEGTPKATARKTAARKSTAKSEAAPVAPEPAGDAGAPAEAAAPAVAARKTAAKKTAAAKKAPAARKTAARKATKTAAPDTPEAPAPDAAPLAAAPAEPPAAAAPASPARAAAGRDEDERPAATLDAVLQCLPELARGQSLALNVAVERLKLAKLMSKSGKSPKFFAQFGPRFELLPPDHPAQVRWRG